MKFIFVTDTHITGRGPKSRKDNYTETAKKKLQEIANEAKRLKVEAVIHGGDLFDKPVVSNQLTGEIANIIRSSGVPWYVVPGNHDLFGYNLSSLPQTSLGLLEKAGVINILDRKAGPIKFAPTWMDDGSHIPPNIISFEGQEYHKDIDKRDPSRDYYTTSDADVRILIPHSMLLDKEYFPDVPYTKVEDLPEITEADLILVGHYHDGYGPISQERMDNTELDIFNPGSALRDEASKGNMTRIPQYIVIDFDDKGNWGYKAYPFKSAKAGKEVLDRSHIDEKKKKEQFLSSFEQKVSNVSLNAIDVRSILQHLIDNDSSIDQEISQEAYDRIEDSEQNEDELGLKGYQEKPNNIYITDVEIKGFQSHDDTKVSFNNGLNAIIGPSDSGKSAIIRALRFALYNQPRGSDFIRHNAKKVYVGITFSDGSKIERERTKSAAGLYAITDETGHQEVFKGFSNDIPIDVPNTHQMPYIQLTKDLEMALNIGMQLETSFLIGESPSTRANVIGRLTGVHLVDGALKELNKNVLANQRDIKSKAEKLNSIDEQLKDYNDLQQMEHQIKTLETEIDTIENQKETLHDLQKLEKDYLNIEDGIIDTSVELQQVTKSANLLQNIQELEYKQNELHQYQKLQNNYIAVQDEMLSIQDELKELHQLDTTEINRLDELVNQYKALSTLQTDKTNVEENIQKINEQLNELPDISSESIEFLAKQQQTLDGLRYLYKDLVTTRKEITEIRKEKRTTMKNEEQSEQLYHDLLHEHGVCPTCNQPIQKES